MSQRIVVALGGNALGKNLTEQYHAVRETAKVIVDLIADGEPGRHRPRQRPPGGDDSIGHDGAHQNGPGEIPPMSPARMRGHEPGATLAMTYSGPWEKPPASPGADKACLYSPHAGGGGPGRPGFPASHQAHRSLYDPGRGRSSGRPGLRRDGRRRAGLPPGGGLPGPRPSWSWRPSAS